MPRLSLPVIAVVAAVLLGALALSALVIASLAPAADLQLSLTDIDNPPVHVDPRRSLQAITLARHRDDVTLHGTASGDTTVTARINGDVVASQHVSPGATGFEMAHVPLPQGWSVLEIEAAAWHGVHHSVNAVTYTVANPDPQPFTNLSLKPKARDNGNVELTGTGPHNSTVVLYDSVQGQRDKEPAPAVELARAHTGDDGTFDINVSLAAGKHSLWAAMPHCEQSKCSSKPPQPLVVDRSAPPPPRFHAKRALALDVTYKHVAIRLEATIPLDDARAHAVIAGAPAKTVVGLLYDDLRINDEPAESLFGGATPRYDVRGDAVTVALSAQQRPSDPILPVLSGPLIITTSRVSPSPSPSPSAEERAVAAAVAQTVRTSPSPAPSPSPSASPSTTWDQDTVRVGFRDYDLSRPRPAPSLSEAQAVTWDHPFEQDGGRVVAALSFAPLESAASFRDLLALPAPQLTGEIPARVLAIVDGLPLALPMLAYLVVTRRRKDAALRPAARVLMGVSLSAPVFLALSSVQHEFAMRILRFGGGLATDALPTRDLLVPLASGLSFVAVAVALGTIFSRDGRAWATVVRESLYAIACAAGLFVLTAVLTYAAHVAAGGNFFTLDPESPALRWYLTAVPLAIAAGSVVVLAPCGSYRADHRRTALLYFVMTAALALAEALPITFGQYVVWADQPVFNGTVFSDVGGPAALALDYLRQAGVLCYFSFGLALLAVPLVGRRDPGLEPQELLKIALCCYAVPATISIMLVPVSFALAWLTFRWILDPDPPTSAECASIRANRSQLTTDVLMQWRPGDVAAKIQDVANKYLNAEIDQAKYEEARARMRAQIDSPVSREAERVFAVPPGNLPHDAPRLALAVASAFVALHVVLFLSTETAALRVAHTAFPLLVLASFVATGAAQFMVPAVVFGWCFESLYGRSGLQKGIAVAVWAIACSFPSWLLRLPSLNSVVAIVVETALFYTALGLAFDVAIVRDAKHARFRLRDLPVLSGVPALSWAGTILLASAGVALNGILSGQLQNVVTSTITSVFRQATIGQ